MGHTLCATIYYGFPLTDDDIDDDDLIEDWEERIEKEANVIPRPDMPEELYEKARRNPESMTPEEVVLWDQYKQHLDEGRKALEDAGCEIDFGGDLDWNENPYYVCVKKRTVNAFDGDSKQLENNFPDGVGDRDMLEKFCKTLEIRMREPGWFLIVHRS